MPAMPLIPATPTPKHPSPAPRRLRGLARAAAWAALAAAASGAAAQRGGPNADQLYATNCAACHGKDLSGGSAPSLLTQRHDPSNPEGPGGDRALYNALRTGHADVADLPASYGELTKQQAWALVVLIREAQFLADRAAGRLGPEASAGVTRTQHHAYTIEKVVGGLETPWAIDWLPDGRALITERGGALRVLGADGSLSDPVRGTPDVREIGQGGLLEVAVHPQHAESGNGWIYLAYTHEQRVDGKPLQMTRIVRGRLAERNAWADEQTIFEAPAETYLNGPLHYGCRIVLHDGHIFWSIGERGRGEHAQDLTRPNGKVHRLHDDGRVPQDNPFLTTPGALPSIWSYGHRNPQGLVRHPLTGDLWDTEHGPRGGDELNRVLPGKNYGWPRIAFSMNYNGQPLSVPWQDELDEPAPSAADPFEMPVYRWMPVIAACGLDVARGDAFPRWSGDLLAGGLAGQAIDRVRVEAGRVVEHETILRDRGRVRDVAVGPDGLVYAVLNQPDEIIRLRPAE